MILHQDHIIRLDYTPATDILEVVYPDLESSLLPEVKISLTLMISTIRNYDVKKLLVDASHSSVDVSDEEGRELSMQLAVDLAKTRLEKLARIEPRDPAREKVAQERISTVKQANLLPYEIQTFSNKADALFWLCQAS